MFFSNLSKPPSYGGVQYTSNKLGGDSPHVNSYQ